MNFFISVCFALLSIGMLSVAKAEEINQDFNDARIIERGFVIGSLNTWDGEYEILRYPENNFTNRHYSFCVSSNSRAFKSAKQFQSDFNSVSPAKNQITLISLDCQEDSPNKLVFLARENVRPNFQAYWSCKSRGRTYKKCKAEFGTAINPNFNTIVRHEMFNLLGFNDTINQFYKNCLLYDNWRLRNRPFKTEFCEIEKRLIPFKLIHVNAGKSPRSVYYIFKAHWQTSEATEDLANKIADFRQGVANKSSETQLKEFCKLLVGSYYCSNVLKLENNWFCHQYMYGETSFCSRYQEDLKSGKVEKPKKKSSGHYINNSINDYQ